MKFLILLLFAAIGVAFGQETATNGGMAPTDPNVTAMDYEHAGDALQGFYAKPEGDGPFPAIVIVP